MSKRKHEGPTEKQIAEIFKENYNKIKNAMEELKKNKIVSHKQIFDVLKEKAENCKTTEDSIKECEGQNIIFRKRIKLKEQAIFEGLREDDFDIFYINGYFFLARTHNQIICPENIYLKYAFCLNNDIESLKGELENFIEYYRTGNVEITENSFVYTNKDKDISIDFTDCKKYIVREMDFEKNSIKKIEILNKNINNPNEVVANNSTTIKEEVNIDNSCPSFDCGLCSFFSSCCGGG